MRVLLAIWRSEENFAEDIEYEFVGFFKADLKENSEEHKKLIYCDGRESLDNSTKVWLDAFTKGLKRLEGRDLTKFDTLIVIGKME